MKTWESKVLDNFYVAWKGYGGRVVLVVSAAGAFWLKKSPEEMKAFFQSYPYLAALIPYIPEISFCAWFVGKIWPQGIVPPSQQQSTQVQEWESWLKKLQDAGVVPVIPVPAPPPEPAPPPADVPTLTETVKDPIETASIQLLAALQAKRKARTPLASKQIDIDPTQ